MSRNTIAVAATLLIPALVAAQSAPAAPDTTPKITFGGFVDGYDAFDFNRPATFDRSFTTQPARHNEFNVNLAYTRSLGADYTPYYESGARLAWQATPSLTAIVHIQGENAVFPKRSAGPSKRNAFVVTSLALTF